MNETSRSKQTGEPLDSSSRAATTQAEDIGDTNPLACERAKQPMQTSQAEIVQNIPAPLPPIIPADVTGALLNPSDPAPAPSKPLCWTDHIGAGSPAAVTVNLPFTAIPGLPALNTVLKKIDRVAHLDLGFTIKGVADHQANPK